MVGATMLVGITLILLIVLWLPAILIVANKPKILDSPYIKYLTLSRPYTININYPDTYKVKTNFSLDNSEYNSLQQTPESVNDSSLENEGFIIELSNKDQNEKAILLFKNKDQFLKIVDRSKEVGEEGDFLSNVKDSKQNAIINSLIAMRRSNGSSCWRCDEYTTRYHSQDVDTIYKVNRHVSYCGTEYSDKEYICPDCLVDLYKELLQDESFTIMTPEEEFIREI